MGGPRSGPSHLLRFAIRSSYGWDSATPFGGSVKLTASFLAGMIVTVRPLLSLTADKTGVSVFRSKISPVFGESEYPAGATKIAAASEEAPPRMTRTPFATESTV